MSLRRGRKRTWWLRCLEQLERRELRPSDLPALRHALLAGNAQAIAILHRAVSANHDADDLLIDLILCLDHDTEELARALVTAFPELATRVAELTRDS